jgi:hypothetical protein
MLCGRRYPKKGKDSSVPATVVNPQRELSEPGNLARFHHTQQRFNLVLTLIYRMYPGIEQQIISTIKTIRKKN